MDSSGTSYCRLCAVKKSIDKLVNLESETTKRGEIIHKLSRLNVNTTEFFGGRILPTTVCLICLSTLDRAYKFVEHVVHAQLLLLAICQNVKIEESISDDDNTEPLPQSTEECTSKNDNTWPLHQKIEVSILENDNTEYFPQKIEESIRDGDNTESLPQVVKQEPVDIVTSTPKKPIKKQTSQPKSHLTWKDYSWACAKCGTEFPNIEEFKSHSMKYHECCNAFRCTDCKKKMLRLDKFVLHVKRHRKHLKLSCYVCHSKFASIHQVAAHNNVHIVSKHVCSGCNMAFTSVEALNEHVKLYYKNQAGNSITVLDSTDGLTCPLCKKTYNTKGSLNGHLLVHVQKHPKKKNKVCDRCGKAFYSKQDLVSHVTSVHNDARPHKCEICKSDFKTLLRLRAHVKIHDNFKPFSCGQCGRTFRLQKQLRSHEIVHTDSLPFVCQYCSKAFRFKSILDLHLRQHTGVKPYCCEICQRNFTNWSNYNKHMKRRHGTSMVKRKVIHTNDNTSEITSSFPIEHGKGVL